MYVCYKCLCVTKCQTPELDTVCGAGSSTPHVCLRKLYGNMSVIYICTYSCIYMYVIPWNCELCNSGLVLFSANMYSYIIMMTLTGTMNMQNMSRIYIQYIHMYIYLFIRVHVLVCMYAITISQLFLSFEAEPWHRCLILVEFFWC